MKVYPAWIYHRDFEPHIVHSEAEETALGPGWVDSPARVNELTETERLEAVEEGAHLLDDIPVKRGRPRKK